MRYLLGLLIILAILIYFDESDNVTVNIYDKSITATPLDCLALSIIPPHAKMQKALEAQCDFSPSCDYRLEVIYTNNIHCNSNQNSDKKALTAFPVSFIRLKVSRGMRVLYSYYKDLAKNATADDTKSAFRRVKSDIRLHCK